MVTYELWNTASRNIVGAYATEAEALMLVREAIEAHGADYADTLALVRDAGGDEVETLAKGKSLVARARAALADSSLGAIG